MSHTLTMSRVTFFDTLELAYLVTDDDHKEDVMDCWAQLGVLSENDADGEEDLVWKFDDSKTTFFLALQEKMLAFCEALMDQIQKLCAIDPDCFDMLDGNKGRFESFRKFGIAFQNSLRKDNDNELYLNN